MSSTNYAGSVNPSSRGVSISCWVCGHQFIRITSNHRTCSDQCSGVYRSFVTGLKRQLTHSASIDRFQVRRSQFKCKGCGTTKAPDRFCHETEYCSKGCKQKSYWQVLKQSGRHAVYHAKKKQNPNWRLRHRLRNRLREVLRAKKQESAIKLLGCPVDFFKARIEQKFSGTMSWSNWGTYWELDHIIPVSKFELSDPKQVAACFHYSNFQPLKASENRIKGDRIISTQPELTISLS